MLLYYTSPAPGGQGSLGQLHNLPQDLGLGSRRPEASQITTKLPPASHFYDLLPGRGALSTSHPCNLQEGLKTSAKSSWGTDSQWAESSTGETPWGAEASIRSLLPKAPVGPEKHPFFWLTSSSSASFPRNHQRWGAGAQDHRVGCAGQVRI